MRGNSTYYGGLAAIVSGARAMTSPATAASALTHSPQKRECVLCKALFNMRAPRAQIMEHVESKHSKQGFDACFPGFVDPK